MRKAGAYIVLVALVASVPAGMGHGGEVKRLDDMIGVQTAATVGAQDTLLDIARRHDLGFVEVRAANPRSDPWLPKPGSRVTVPGAHILPDVPRVGIVINLADQRLYYFRRKSKTVVTYPLGTPREGKVIPLGITKIVGKRKNPIWHPPDSLRRDYPELPGAISPGPDNPLGKFALDMGWVGFVIHGTNKPYGIGRRVSAGCIRLYPEDISRLFSTVSIGETVTVVNQPAKAGWSGKRLYLEIHPDGRALDAIEESGRANPTAYSPIPDLRRQHVLFAESFLKHPIRLGTDITGGPFCCDGPLGRLLGGGPRCLCFARPGRRFASCARISRSRCSTIRRRFRSQRRVWCPRSSQRRRCPRLPCWLW